jgi:predicted house-cleaning noncanonical NTP pyrophosphatase (MazG superfamily)
MHEVCQLKGTTVGKLVRDRIPEIIRASGKEPATRVLDDLEYARALRAKLFEEAEEAVEADEDHLAEEIADVLEVLQALALSVGLGWASVERIADEKRQQRGGFASKTWLR